MRLRALNEKMKTVYKLDQLFGNITKLMVFRVKRMERKRSHASSVIQSSLVAAPLGLLHIFLVDLFSNRRNQMANLVYQCVKMVTIGMYDSKMLRKFSTHMKVLLLQ